MAWYCVLAAILLISSPVQVQSSPCSWVEVVKSWSTGFMAEVKIQMEETVDRWSVALQFTQAVQKFEAWKGHVTRISDVNYTVDNNCYNSKIYSCQCFQFPYLVRHQPQWTSNTTVNFNGRFTQTCSSDPCSGLSLTNAIKAVEKTVHRISEDLQKSMNSKTNRYKRQAETYSEDENDLLKEMNNLLNYFKSRCILEVNTCNPNDIETFRVQLESIFNNMKNTRSSQEFVDAFELLRKEFDEIIKHLRNGEGVNTPTCSNEVQTDSLCKCGQDICSQSYICSREKCFKDCQAGNKSEGKRLKRASPQECLSPPSKDNGQWSCNDDNKYCDLKCNPGYASLFSSTTCIGGAWTDLDKMECLPSLFLLLGGRFNKSASGFRDKVDFYHPSVENLTCHKPPPVLNKNWRYHTTFTHNGLVYLCGGDVNPKDVCSSLNMTKESGQWKTHNIPTVKTSSHSAIVMQNKVYFIGGLRSGSGCCADNVFTELPLENEPILTTVPNLSYGGWAECVIKIDQHSFVITGGNRNEKNVTAYNVIEQSSTTLPKLQEERRNHGCVVIEENGKQWIVVAGGRDSQQTTERLDLNGGSQWESLGLLKNGRYNFGMGVTANGIFAVGGEGLITIKLEILNMTSKQWMLDESNVKPEQYEFGLVEVPAEVFQCDLRNAMETGPPSPADNVDIANKCCFIIRSGTNDGTSQTYILTSPFRQECTDNSTSSGCAYTLYTEEQSFDNVLSIYHKGEQVCFKQIKNPVCCSQVNGSLCQQYGSQTGAMNIPYEGFCSDVCKEIADCSSDSKTEEEEEWCKSHNISSPSTNPTTKTRRESSGITTRNVYDHSKLIDPPASCTAKYPAIAIQSAVSYPRALAGNSSEIVRSTKSCGTWNMWIFNCWHMFGYSKHISHTNWFYWEYEFEYEKKKWIAYTRCYYVKNNCCAALQVQCGFDCKISGNNKCP